MKTDTLRSDSAIRLLIFLLAFTSSVSLSAEYIASGYAFPFRQITQQLQQTYQAHPFVALPAPNILSPDPDQLRIQDLRGIECYAQPDALQVCGAGDTIPVLLYTKSVAPLQDITVEVFFDEGLEYGGFAVVDNSVSVTNAQLDTISTENLEAPSFLLDEVSQAGGGVVLYLGTRASCGVDFQAVNPDITLRVSYVSTEGVACTNVVTLENYGANVLVPQVVIPAIPSATNLGRPGTAPCQAVQVTQATVAASATGYLFTADNYGFDLGIRIADVQLDNSSLSTADFTIDPATGRLTLPVDFPTADGLLDFNETQTVRVCYTYPECFPNVDFFPEYSVVSTCEGVFCTGPVNVVTSGGLRSNFPQNPRWEDPDFVESTIDLSTGDPYTFEVTLSGVGNDPIADQFESVVFRLRRCQNPDLFLSLVQVIDQNSGAVVGTLDPAVYTVRGTDAVNGQGVPTADRAGTVIVDLRLNDQVSGGGLADTDGDGFFDDIPGDESVRIRFTYELACDPINLSCNNQQSLPGGTPPGSGCRFRQITLLGRTGCNVRNRSASFNLDGTDFDNENTSSYANAQDITFGGITSTGYDFGRIGLVGGVPRSSTQRLEFTYTLDDLDPFNCSDPTVATTTFVLQIIAPERYTQNIDFDNIQFENNPIPAGDITIDRSVPSEVTLFVANGNAAANTNFTYSLDATLDTAACSPRELFFLDAYLTTDCNGPLDCAPVRTCQSAILTADPDSTNCVCTYDLNADIRRKNYDFTNSSRTIAQEATGVAEENTRRFISGDTMLIDYSLIVRDNADPLFNQADRLLQFRVDLRLPDQGFQTNERLAAMFDQYTTRVNSFQLCRADQTTIDLGAAFSGPINGTLAQTGLTINNGGSSTDPAHYGPGEPPIAAFPNGGYAFATNNASNDAADGRILGVFFRNIQGERNAVGELFDIIGGKFLPLDTIKMQLEVVLIDNPGWNGSDQTLNIQPVLLADAYIGDPAGGQRRSVGAGRCAPDPNLFFYRSPVVSGSSEIVYRDDCEAELIVRFEESNIPDDWFTDEYRLVAGVEDFTIDIPSPYYYAGGATVETAGTGLESIEPDSTRLIDSAVTLGLNVLYPEGIVGQFKFVDAERLDGVRPTGYAGFGGPDEALNDVTTVGGTFPLIGVQGGVDDPLTFRIPLLRACPAPPVSTLSLDYNAANLYLPDLRNPPTYITNGGTPFWTDRIRDNDGNLVAPIANRYLPFPRLNPGEGEAVSRERQTDIVVDVTQPVVTPEEIVQTASFASPGLIDMPGTETNTYELCPEAGSLLTPGVLLIETTTSVELRSISGDASSFSLVSASPAGRTFAVEVPAGTIADECFEIVLETELLFCSEGQVCLSSLPGCTPANVSIEQQVAVYDALELDCALTRCYAYEVGTVVLDLDFDAPVQSDLCTSQEYGVLLTNQGTGTIVDFMPILFLPQGFVPDPNSFEITFLGGTPSAVTAPVANPDSNAVIGTAFLFDQNEVANALGGTAAVPPGAIVAITFTAETTCDFIDGSNIGAKVNARNLCSEAFSTPEERSPALRVVPGMPADPVIDFVLPEDLSVSCSADGSATSFLITAINTGKGTTGMLEVMLTLPDGISIDPAAIVVIAPEGVLVDDVAFTDMGGGVSMFSFNGPDMLGPGEILCFEVPIVIDGADCGVYTAELAVKQRTEVVCQATGMSCDIATILSEEGFFEIEVVPAAAIGGNTTLLADCGATPGTFDLTYNVEVVAPSDAFNGAATVELYDDINENGRFEANIDQLLAAGTPVNVAVDSGGVRTLTGTFPGIVLAETCPVILRLEAEGCTCTQATFPIADIRPAFLEALGESVALCPGETATIEDACADFNYTFAPASAGFVTQNNDGSISFGLNPGVAEGTLRISGTFGTCAVDEQIPVTSPTPFVFGPFAAEVCREGAQQIDLGIPVTLQEDLQILITPATSIEDPTSFEPVVTDLANDATYNVNFQLPGGCEVNAPLMVTVATPPEVTLRGTTGCLTGIRLDELIEVTPADLTGTFQTTGDGTFSTGNRLPGVTRYLPGPGDRAAGEVAFRFVSDDPDGPCGPEVARNTFTILIVDCGSFFWNGQE